MSFRTPSDHPPTDTDTPLDLSQTNSSSNTPPSLSFWTDTTEGSTFQSAKLKHWTESHLTDASRVLNPCAGTTQLDLDADVLRVDINETAHADLHIDFRNLPDHVDEESFSGIVYDPPYTPHQARSKYQLDISDEGFYFYSPAVKHLFDTLLEPGGIFIQFGYTTATMPPELNYQLESVSLFNKLGSQNDYLGVAARKPSDPSQSPSPPTAITSTETVTQNAGATEIDAGDISTGGNGGNEITMQYHHPTPETPVNDALSEALTPWLTETDRVLHLFEDTPQTAVHNAVETYVTCRYDAPDLDSPSDPAPADVIEQPWNLNARFATDVFDVVLLDIPHSAFQRNIRTPRETGTQGTDVTHVDTALKRSLTDLVAGDGGRVIQIGRTATLMSSIEYDYQREAVTVVSPPDTPHDRIIAVDAKPHTNLEVVGLGDGEVDALHQHPHGAPDITSKHNRSDFTPDPDSTFCVHCGNRFFHHPAMYLHCPDCNAAAGTLCVTPEGFPIHPSGPNSRTIPSDIHTARLEKSAEYHSGPCNSTSRTELPPKSEDNEPVTTTTQSPPSSEPSLSDFQ